MRLPNSYEFVPDRVQDPRVEALTALKNSNISVACCGTEDIVTEVLELADRLEPRWDIFCNYIAWRKKCENTKGEPMYWDSDLGIERSARQALSPCPLINTYMHDKKIDLALSWFQPHTLQSVLKALAADEETTSKCLVLREVAIHSEEDMEQEALGIVFKIITDYPTSYIEMTKQMAENRTKHPTVVDLLEVLVSELPLALQTQHPTSYPGLVFQYFLDYCELVKAELQLLTVPAILQNSAAPYHFSSAAELMNNNPVIGAALQLASQSQEIKSFIASFPELFGHKNLAEKTFTFVGAGFPLTGIILHIETGGAAVNLVDYDPQAVISARKFIEITENLGITRPGAIKVILANATEVTYIPAEPLVSGLKRLDGAVCPAHCPLNPEMGGRIILPTDILDLASALTAETTAQVIRESSSLVSTIRKRNVRGISELFYELFTLPTDDGNTFRLAGEVTPPQKVVSGASPGPLVTGLMSTCNINSCQLYVDTCNFDAKFAYLDAMLDMPVYEQLKNKVGAKKSSGIWDQRIKEYYRK